MVSAAALCTVASFAPGQRGPVDAPATWPLRHSHSPGELIDVADVHALARPVAALAGN